MSADTAFILIDKPVAEVFAFMADPTNMDIWSFGTWRTDIDGTGLVRGTSIKDGAVIYVRIDAHPAQNLIDYHVGSDPDSLLPRVFVRITPGAVFDVDGCALTMTAMRSAGMDDARWHSLKAMHVTEVELIKGALETGYDHRNA